MKLQHQVLEGNEKISLTIKEIVYTRNSNVFELLDFDNDKIFLEPLLFVSLNFANKSQVIDQVVWGYIEEQKRPEEITVETNSIGVIYLPNFGYLHTEFPNANLTLMYKESRIVLTIDNKVVNYTFEPLNTIGANQFEILKYSIPLFENLFTEEDGSRTTVNNISDQYFLNVIERALSIIEKCDEEYFECLKLTVRKILLYEGTPNSFATMSAHGIAFFNVRKEDSVVFFIDNIVHQCGHIIFNSICFEKEKLFTVLPSEPLSRFTGDEHDTHDIFGRFHGLFTQSNINTILDRCIDSDYFNEKEYHELLGRFTSNMTRFKIAFGKLNHPIMYTELGLKWFRYFENTYKLLFTKRKSLLDTFVVDNQPYVFSYKVFVDSNPLKK